MTLPLLFDGAVLAQVELQTAGPVTDVGVWLSRFAVYVAITITIGALVAAAWLVPGDGGRLTPSARRAARAAAWGALGWTVAALGLLAFGLSNAAARPVAEVLRPELLSSFVGTRFGAFILLSAVVAALVAGLAATARTVAGAQLALAGAVLGALGPSLWGHAGGAGPLALLSDVLHVIGSAAWVGGLAALVGVVLRGAADPVTPTQRYSRLAGIAVVVVGVSGVVSASVHVDEPGQVLSTAWGRLVLVKLGLFALIAAIGWLIRTQRLPALASGGAGATHAFRRLAGAEVAVMVAALAVAATMASGIPAGADAASSVQTFRTAFGDGTVDISVDPGSVGANTVHVYWFDAQDQPLQAQNRSLTFTQGDLEVEVPLFVAGPGHDTSPGVEIPAAGTWTVTATGVVGGEERTASGSVTIR